ncbi:MAG: cytochrome P450 [Acidimicrobiia bacterium]|nr:cytochrome P450 [Acidimicrobiia bacterium]
METNPVQDWSTDYDVTDVGYQTNPYPIWDELRQTCPVARTERLGGSVLPTNWDDIAAVAYDTDRFSSRDVGVLPIPAESSTALIAPPITSDPPFHTEARRILLPFFSPKAVERLTVRTREIAAELLDVLEPESVADAAGDYAQHIPVRVITHMLGIARHDEPMFTEWAIDIFQRAAEQPELGRSTTRAILAYFEGEVADRRVEGRDDLITELLRAELDGAPLTDKHVLGTCFLLLMAGIDTTWSSIGSSLWHLATHPEDRDRLVAEPELIPTAVEELLRAYAPVTMARVAVEDTAIGDCPVHAGDKVLLPFPAGNRDPEKFERADAVVLDRARNRHFAFGIGIHRCLGSNLARMELQVAIEAWLERFPRFELVPGVDVRWAGTQVRGPREIPVDLRGAG